MGKITKYLNQLIVGNVFDDPEVLEAYATDRSVLKIKPKFVAFPESTDDIRKLMRFFNQIAAREIPVSIAPRGSGLDEGGADLTNGLVISTEKLNRLLEIDTRERLVRVQAGITLKELNTALSVSGLTIPIGGHDQDTIGGLIANAPVDPYADKYGGIQNFVERIEAILPNGECLQTNRLRRYTLAKKAAEKSFEGELYRRTLKLLRAKEKFIQEFDIQRTGLAGYPSIAKIYKRESLDLAPLFFGSQGTLGIISEVILKAIPLRDKTVRVVATFRELEAAISFMDTVKLLKPREINICDLKIVQEAKASGKNLDGVIRKMENGFVVSMAFDERRSYIMRKLARLREDLPRTTKLLFDTPENQLAIGEFDNSLAYYLGRSKKGECVPVLTDFYVPAVNLADFMKDLKVLGEKLELDLALFGSYSTGIYNLRPRFKLDEEDASKKIATFLKAGAYVIGRQGGRLAGGMPEGRLKAIVTNNEMLDAAKDTYKEVKKLFDPNGILNPDVKLGAESRFTLTHFRDKELPMLSP